MKKLFLPYIPLIFLLAMFVARYFTVPSTPNIQENFETEVTLISPIQIKDSQVVLYTSGNYKVLSYHVSKNIEVGDILKISGVKYYSNIYADKIELKGPSTFKSLFQFKSHLVNKSNSYLREPHSSLFNGIMWGTKPDISDDFHDKLIRVGIIHIVVVSGYNISILFSVALKSLSRFGLKYSIALGILLAFIYSLIVGFDPPVVRALIMGVLLGIGRAYGQVKSVIYVLIVTVLFMLIYRPMLLYSVSLQLTFSATLGILLLTDFLKNLLEKHLWFVSLPQVIQEDLMASIGAQIFVIPLLLYYFDGISLVSFILNPLILWTIPLIMALGGLFLVFAVLELIEISLVLAYILTSFLGFVIKFVNFFSFIPKGYIQTEFGIFHLICSYTFIFAVYFYMTKKFKAKSSHLTNIH